MLDEGRRRLMRGTDVVVGAVTVDGRVSIQDLLRELPVSGCSDTGGDTSRDVELDVEALLDRRPELALVDDMAHTCGHGRQRWQDIERLLDSGIDVITTVSVTNLDSLADVVSAITGSLAEDTVPDAVVRRADQVELVDMTPEALRRRLAHGHVYPAERVDAALANLFRPENLGALRQLALLWVADRVDEQLRERSTDTGDVRERVVVALTGVGGDRLVRRAARIAGRVGGQLIGVHVVREGRPPGADLEAQRRVIVEAGGSYREILGNDVAEALRGFVRVEQATQLVVGATRPGSGRRRRSGSVVDSLVGNIGTVDVHVVATDAALATSPVARLHRPGPVSERSRWWAWLLCIAGLPLLTALLSKVHDQVSVGSALLLDLCIVLAVATLGGLIPGLVASVFAFALTNWFLTPPLHTLTVGDDENVVALTVFVVVTVVVSVLVDRVARRTGEALRARSGAGALARSSATLVGAHDPLPELVEQLRTTFGLRAVSVLERSDHGWWPLHTVGEPELLEPTAGTSFPLSDDGSVLLVLSTDVLGYDELEVLRAFADQLSVAVQGRRLRAEAESAELLVEANALRSALLQAVSHDFRTPLATIKASATGMLQTEVEFTEADRRALLTEIDEAADRLGRMVRDLLDMSRIQAGAVELALVPVALEEVVAAALSGLPHGGGTVTVTVADDLPLVHADAALLERVCANLISNALIWSPAGVPVTVAAGTVEAGTTGASVDLRIIDRGPGVPLAERDRMFTPFQRFGDRSHDAGVGLGLAIARGFIDAMGAELQVDDTPGGGLTMSIRLAVAREGHTSS
jgi:two-component system sensor histidine kinase KdpD